MSQPSESQTLERRKREVAALEALAKTGRTPGVDALIARLKRLITSPAPMTDPDDDNPEAEPDALVGARLSPRPHLNSGAIALPLPEEESGDLRCMARGAGR